MSVQDPPSETVPDPREPVGDSVDESEGPAPAVVMVMVAHDPGPWFEETLESVAVQDYPALSVLVIDAASTDPDGLRARVAAVVPDAHLRRITSNPGYATAANEALVAVQGAAFYLFCHDDIRLAPDAVRLLVEEAFRSNAGIVGPKLVDWNDSRRLLSVGMGADRFGAPAPYVERGDLDQEQHDAVRDVFYIPGAATLVRADLFEAVGGFDGEMTFHGEDLDLCWRAHVAGARVIAAPAAVVAHLEALGVRRPVDDRRRLQSRHRLRSMRVSDTAGSRIRAVPEAAVLSLMEIVQAIVLGHFRRARDIWSAWTWNIAHASSARARREGLSAIRRVPDGEVHAFQARGSARLSGFLRSRVVHSDAAVGGRALVSNLRAARSSTSFIVWAIVVLYMLAGSREVILHGVPAVGDFVSLLGPGQMLSRWSSGWQSVGLGSSGPSPTGFGILGILGGGLFGAVGLLRTLLILGMWPLGAVGMWRFTRPIGSGRARLLAIVAYVAIPVAPNALAQGQWGTLVVYALLPWILIQYAAASRLAPFGDVGDPAGPGTRVRPLLHRAVLAGLVIALGASIDPAIIPIAVATAAVLAIGGTVAGQLAGSLRILTVGIVSGAVALVLHLPWSLSFLDGWSSMVGVSSNGGYSLDVGDVLRFGSGPFGTGLIGWAVLITAGLALFIGRRWRLGWAVRGWILALSGFALAWVSGQGWLIGSLPPASSMLVPAAIGIALAASLGMAAFESDLPDYHFGWRQILSVVAAGAFVLALVPAFAAATSGRWELPRGDFNRTLSFLGDDPEAGVSRVLWLGDASALPLSGWALDAPAVDDLGPGRTLAYATTMGGTPTIAEQWSGAETGSTTRLADALRTAADGGTARLGALLAPMGVRYVVVPVAPAPEPYAKSRTYVPADLISVLDSQLDLASITVNPGVRVYRNSTWTPVFAELPSDTQLPQGGSQLADRTDRVLSGAPPLFVDGDGYASWTGDLQHAADVYAAVGGSDWKLEVDGATTERSSVFGWSNSFAVDGGGSARIYFDTPATRRYLLLGQVLLWIVAIVWLLRVRVRIEENNDLAASIVPEDVEEVQPIDVEPGAFEAAPDDSPAVEDLLASIVDVPVPQAEPALPEPAVIASDVDQTEEIPTGSAPTEDSVGRGRRFGRRNR